MKIDFATRDCLSYIYLNLPPQEFFNRQVFYFIVACPSVNNLW